MYIWLILSLYFTYTHFATNLAMEIEIDCCVMFICSSPSASLDSPSLSTLVLKRQFCWFPIRVYSLVKINNDDSKRSDHFWKMPKSHVTVAVTPFFFSKILGQTMKIRNNLNWLDYKEMCIRKKTYVLNERPFCLIFKFLPK